MNAEFEFGPRAKEESNLVYRGFVELTKGSRGEKAGVTNRYTRTAIFPDAIAYPAFTRKIRGGVISDFPLFIAGLDAMLYRDAKSARCVFHSAFSGVPIK